MPEYRIGDQHVRRKNWYMPCVVNARFGEMSPDEQARILKATYWADNITNAEWPAVLGEDGFSPSAKSKLKRKASGWLVALARIHYLNPELFEEVVAKAAATYEEQIEDSSWVLNLLEMQDCILDAFSRQLETKEASNA